MEANVDEQKDWSTGSRLSVLPDDWSTVCIPRSHCGTDSPTDLSKPQFLHLHGEANTSCRTHHRLLCEHQERECSWKCAVRRDALYNEVCSCTLTKHGSCGHGLSVQPEWHLGENDSHDARQVCLNHKIPDFSFQVEMSCHYGIFTWKKNLRGLRNCSSQSFAHFGNGRD